MDRTDAIEHLRAIIGITGDLSDDGVGEIWPELQEVCAAAKRWLEEHDAIKAMTPLELFTAIERGLVAPDSDGKPVPLNLPDQ